MTATNSEPRSWTINGDFLGLEQTGVARYGLEVTRALDALVTERHPLTRDLRLDLVTARKPPAGLLQSIPFHVVPEYSKPRLPQVWVQLQLPRHVRGGLLSFCNLAPIQIRRHIVCIHDLHTVTMPESYPLLFRLAHRAILPILGRRARIITTVSNFVRDQLAENGVAPAEKVVVTYNGSDHAERWSPTGSATRTGPRPYVVCLGRKQKYKNGELIWRIADQLDEIGIDIYMAGSVDQATLETFGPKVPRNVRLLGRISDDDLAKVLSEAQCFLFPSRIEGFGLPAVEAMARGCPVVASTSPSLPEVCGGAALFAGPDDPDAWMAAIRRLVCEPRLRESMTAAGYARARIYSWRRIAETYLELMTRVDGSEADEPRSAPGRLSQCKPR